MFDDQLAVPGQVDIDHLNVRLLPTDFIFPRQRAANPPVAALIMDGIDPQFRLALLVAYLEQPPLPDQMGAEELRDEAFVPGIGRSEARRVGKECVRTCRAR